MNLLPSKHAGKISARGPISGPSFTLILSPSISVIALRHDENDAGHERNDAVLICLK